MNSLTFSIWRYILKSCFVLQKFLKLFITKFYKFLFCLLFVYNFVYLLLNKLMVYYCYFVKFKYKYFILNNRNIFAKSLVTFLVFCFDIKIRKTQFIQIRRTFSVTQNYRI